jgi:hypothetical protein
MKLLLCVLLLGLVVLPAEFPTVMAEENLEKRSALALKEADGAITAAKKAYDERSSADFRSRLADVRELVNLSYKSLNDTGKRARKSPKHFKRAELAIRGLVRRLETLASEVSVDDRDPVTATIKALNDVHGNIVHDIMTKK